MARNDSCPAEKLSGPCGLLTARTSAAAACRIAGRGCSSFTADDVMARFPQHDRASVAKALENMLRTKVAMRRAPGVYRLRGEV